MLSSIKNKILLPATLFVLPGIVLAQATDTAPASWGNWLDINILLLIIAIVLLLPIFVLGKALLLSAQIFVKKLKEKGGATVLLPALLMLGTYSVFAQDAAATAPASAVASSSLGTTTWVLLIVIIAEALVILVLGSNTLKFLRADAPEVKPASGAVAASTQKSWISEVWNKLNSFKSMEEESNIDTGHDYDGIRELDNVTPPWFKAAFAFSIVFAIFYLWRYHVSKTAPLQIEEFETEMAQAKLQQEEYLKTQAKGVDENSVVLLTAATDISAGQAIFKEKCAVCHKEDGGGMVGPNLTDDYWIHGGTINNVFKTIKYGVPDKGMIPWQDQLSADQIAQVASYVKSIHGTNPPGAKEKQGDLFTETAAVADTAVAKSN